MNGGYLIFFINFLDRIDVIFAFLFIFVMMWTSVRRWMRIEKRNHGSTFVVKFGIWMKRLRGKDVYSVSNKERDRIVDSK